MSSHHRLDISAHSTLSLPRTSSVSFHRTATPSPPHPRLITLHALRTPCRTYERTAPIPIPLLLRFARPAHRPCLFLPLIWQQAALGDESASVVRRASHRPRTPIVITRRAPCAARLRRTASPFPAAPPADYAPCTAHPVPHVRAHRPHSYPTPLALCTAHRPHVEHVYFFRSYDSRRHSASVAFVLLPPCISLHLPQRVTCFSEFRLV